MSVRTPEALIYVIRGLALEMNFAFQPHTRLIEGKAIGPLTLCSDAINALTLPLGCPVPIDLPLKPGETLANAQHDWLLGPAGKAQGWFIVDPETARQRAETGFPTVATWKNATGGHGHIMLVRPAPPTKLGHMYVAGAGTRTSSCLRIEDSFGLSLHPDFVTHD